MGNGVHTVFFDQKDSILGLTFGYRGSVGHDAMTLRSHSHRLLFISQENHDFLYKRIGMFPAVDPMAGSFNNPEF